MIIKSLYLENFRQFASPQEIIFSTDNDKKVTIIEAESGVGKTTLLQAFSWVFYGTCKYSRILNAYVEKCMAPSENKKVTCRVILENDGKTYEIIRTQIFRKIQVRIDADESNLIINYPDENGISKQVRNNDAKIIIKRIMPHDLFPYFFLEGESLSKVGEQMASGKSGQNGEFVKAIKGLLHFNHLYETMRHLKTVCDDYSFAIGQNTSNASLKKALDDIQQLEEFNKTFSDRIEAIDKSQQYYKDEKAKLDDQIMEYGEAAGKQKRVNELRRNIEESLNRIKEQKKALFKKFSTNGFYLILKELCPDCVDVLKNSDSLDKGIPGIDVSAVQYMLGNHKCICGEELVEGSEHWKILNDWIKYLPPNNIGYELDSFNKEIKQVDTLGTQFDDDFKNARKVLSDLIKDYDRYLEEYQHLNEEIKGIDVDISKLKTREQEYDNKIVDLSVERRSKEAQIESNKKRIEELNKSVVIYKQQDSRTKQLQVYYDYAFELRNRINRFCERKEKEKRETLKAEINEIFKQFYNEKISFHVNSSYNVEIKIFDSELSDDFTSGGQDIAVALAFIGAIIRVNGIKTTNSQQDEIDEEEEKELYPLVMDAPTTKFGMKQMSSFSDLMPKITDQIIVFINDKDGPILIEKMAGQIGSRWSLKKEDSYHTSIIRESGE